MRFEIIVLPFLLLSVSSIPPHLADEHKNEHVVDKPLSDEPHEVGGEHNPDYDHEAFVGEEEAKTFEDMTPAESKEKLGKIIDKIDKDNDGQVSQHELKDWIQYVQKRYVIQDVDRQWEEFEKRDFVHDDKIVWDEYKKRTYGFIEEEGATEEPGQYDHMILRDEKRWRKADANNDGRLNKEEYMDFLHPEDSPRMRDIVVEETMADIDKNKDGFISLEEYIGDMWPNENKEEEEPEWVQSEREQFTKQRDQNGDGKMDFDETRDWVLPDDYDHSEAEMKHLFYEADDNKDGVLSREEILNKYDVFVGSQATDYGEALHKHDEF